MQLIKDGVGLWRKSLQQVKVYTKLLQLIHVRFSGRFMRPRIIPSILSSSFIRLDVFIELRPVFSQHQKQYLTAL